MNTRPTTLARNTGLVIAAEAHIGHISYTEALAAHRLDLGQKMAAAIDTADLFKAQGHADWAAAEMDALRGYAAELLAIVDFGAADIHAIVVTERLARQSRHHQHTVDCGEARNECAR